MDRGAWWAIVHGVAESDMTEQLTCLALEALKIPSPLGLVFYSVPPALTGPASLGSFSIVQLLVLALWGESGYSDGCTPYT